MSIVATKLHSFAKFFHLNLFFPATVSWNEKFVRTKIIKCKIPQNQNDKILSSTTRHSWDVRKKLQLKLQKLNFTRTNPFQNSINSSFIHILVTIRVSCYSTYVNLSYGWRWKWPYYNFEHLNLNLKWMHPLQERGKKMLWISTYSTYPLLNLKSISSFYLN